MKQGNRILVAALSTLLTAILLGGCGSGNRDGGSQSGNPLFGGVATVGDTACNQCHSANTEALTGETLVSQYQLNSPHNVAGLGCESCHGGGAGHNGVGPIPYPLAGLTPNQIGARCVTCHNGTTSLPVNGVATTPRATNSNNFEASNHYVGTPSHLDSGVTCTRCHTNEGAVLGNQEGWTGTKDVITDPAIQAKIPLFTEYTGINCDTCHQHGGGLRVVKGTTAAGGTVVNWDPNANNRTDQFDLCTSCHTMYNYNGSLLLVDGNTHGGVATGVVGYHETSWYRIIATTHFDNPNTTNVIEGYNLRKTGENPCFDCHGHEAKTETRNASRIPPTDATIHTDWAKSAHAGKLLALKSAAGTVAGTMIAGADATTGDGWVHYNWDDTGSRGSCQRCHTATGASNYMTAPATYDPANNDFSHLSGWSASGGSPQNELLYCWGCHSNAGTGALRRPGAITEAYGDVGDPTTTISYPDISGSNVCMTCHLGREIGAVIKSDQDADGVRSFINSHYLTAGGQLFGTTGYEYDGRSYANPSFFAHDKIGSSAAPGTGTNGPCAGCHMKTPNSHSFLPVTKDEATGAITAITSTACVTCHSGGYALTPAGLTTEEEEYEAAISAVLATLASKGIHFFEAHPYFYTGPGGTGDAFTNWAGVYGLALWKDVMGAAFNANLLIHDPGGYAHNRFYSKRLLWDSIDFIYDGILNNDVTAAIDAQVTAARLDSATAAAAKEYLGTTRP